MARQFQTEGGVVQEAGSRQYQLEELLFNDTVVTTNGTLLHSMMNPAMPWYGPKIDPSDTASSAAKDLQAADFMFSGILAIVVDLSSSVFDTVSLTEFVSATQVFTSQSSDSITVSENTLAPLLAMLQSATDSITVSENTITPLLSQFSTVSDTVTVSESVGSTQVFTSATSDVVTASETIANLLSLLPGVISDTVTTTESVNATQVFTASTSDVVTVSETTLATQVFTSQVADVVTVSEDIARLLSLFLSVSDAITITEAILNDGDTKIISVFDSATLTESVTAIQTMLFSVFDLVTVSEDFTYGASWAAIVFDTVTVTDATGESLTWTIRSGATAIENVKVWLSYADPYTAENLVRGSIQLTNSSGQVTYFLDWDTVYYGWRDHRQYTFPDPFQFRYSTSNGRWEEWDGTAYVEWTP